jgi:hypothetical protein
MAINVDTVYKTVLFILNKEQRGYITPAEFERLGQQAQLEIFERYFEDLNQALRMPENDSEYANRVKTLEEKIQEMEINAGLNTVISNLDTIHRLGTLVYAVNGREIQEVTRHELTLIQKSKLTAPTLAFPVYQLSNNGTNTILTLYPTTILNTDVEINYIPKPPPPKWDYNIQSLGQFVWTGTSGASVNFSISDQDQTELILTILMYAGVVIRDQSIIQAAASQVAQENANQKT